MFYLVFFLLNRTHLVENDLPFRDRLDTTILMVNRFKPIFRDKQNIFKQFQIKNQRQSYIYKYQNNANVTREKQISMLNINDISIINKLIRQGYEVLPSISLSSQYVFSDRQIEIIGFHFIEMIKFQNSLKFNQGIHIRGVIQYFNRYIAKSLLTIVLVSLISKTFPISLQPKKENEFSIFFISKSCHILTQYPSNLPNQVQLILKKIRNRYNMIDTEEEIFVSQNSGIIESYKIRSCEFSESIYMISIFHIFSAHKTFECETLATGSIYRNDYEEKQQITASLKFDSNSIPSATFILISNRQYCNIKILPAENSILPLGRQSLEIDRVMFLQKSLLHKYLKMKPSRKGFLLAVKEAYDRMDYSCVALFMDNETLCNYCDDQVLKEFVNDLHVKFINIVQNEVERLNFQAYRLAYHTITVEGTRYMMVIAALAKVNILRSVEYFFHAVLSLLIVRNHTKLCVQEFQDQFIHLEKIFNSGEVVYIEKNFESIRFFGHIFGQKITKSMSEKLFAHVEKYVQDTKMGEVIKQVVPYWRNFKCHYLSVTGYSALSKYRKIPVATLIIRDVTNMFKHKRYDAVLFAAMMNLQRVDGKTLHLESPKFASRLFNEIPHESFSALTRISDMKTIHNFTTKPVDLFRLIKEDSSSIMASSVPTSGNDFFIFPLKNIYKTLECHKISSMSKTSFVDDSRLSILDLGSDSYIDFRIPTAKIFVKEFNDRKELKHSPICRKHLESIAGRIFAKSLDTFIKAVNDCFNFGHSSEIVQIQEIDKIRSFLVTMNHKDSVLAVHFISIEEEASIATETNVVQTAMDAFGTGRIMPYKYEYKFTPDRDYTNAPSGFLNPMLLSETSFKNIYLPEHRRQMRQQIDAGRVDMVFIVKYEKLHWYYSRGSMYKDDLRGVCINIPGHLLQSKYRPAKMNQLSLMIKSAFNHLAKETGADISEFTDAYNDVLVAFRIEDQNNEK